MNTHKEKWLTLQINRFKSLSGMQVRKWIGMEMALTESNSELPHIWEHETIPMLQMEILHLVLPNGPFVISTAQDDDLWGLYCPEDRKDMEWNLGPESIFRNRDLPELPIGEIERVIVECQDENVATVELLISGHSVLLRAGEVYEEVDGTYRVYDMDESILIQVDGKRPTIMLNELSCVTGF